MIRDYCIGACIKPDLLKINHHSLEMIKLVLPLAGLHTFSGVLGFTDELEPVYDDYGLDEGRIGDDYAM